MSSGHHRLYPERLVVCVCLRALITRQEKICYRSPRQRNYQYGRYWWARWLALDLHPRGHSDRAGGLLLLACYTRGLELGQILH